MVYQVKDFSQIREQRQIDNYDRAREYEYDDNYINPKAMNRVCDYLRLSKKELVQKVSNNPMAAKLLAICVSKNSSRQGTRDEETIIEGVRDALKPHGISIKKCKTNDLVPIKNESLVLPRKEAKRRFGKENLLKSFDFRGTISEINLEIYGFAKIRLGKGGHQDNVLHEAREVIEWADKHGDKNSLYVFMIDTDNDFESFVKLAKGKSKNIWICTHKTFQEQIIKKISKAS